MTNIFQAAEYQQELAAQRTFMARVYGWMTIGLLVTALLALACATVEPIRNTLWRNQPLMIGLIIVQFLVAMGLGFLVHRLPSVVSSFLFVVYSALTGVMLSSVLLVYTTESVAATFFITAGTFGTMSAFGYVTKKDLTSLGMFLMMGLIGLLIAIVVNMFLASSMLGFLISCVGVVVFTLLTAYDTQIIKQKYADAGYGSEGQMRLAIAGAFSLYLDFINLFIYLLRLLGSRRD